MFGDKQISFFLFESFFSYSINNIVRSKKCWIKMDTNLFVIVFKTLLLIFRMFSGGLYDKQSSLKENVLEEGWDRERHEQQRCKITEREAGIKEEKRDRESCNFDMRVGVGWSNTILNNSSSHWRLSKALVLASRFRIIINVYFGS